MTDSTLDPVLRSRLIERVRVVARTHSRSFDSASADDPLGYGCLCGFKRTSLNPPGDYATHLAAVVVDALGIEVVACGYACDLQDLPVFRLRAVESD